MSPSGTEHRSRDRLWRTGLVTGVPPWVRVALWAGIAAATVSSAPPDTTRRIVTAAVMVVAGAAMLLANAESRRLGQVCVTLAAAAGVAGIALSPSGIAEVPVFMAATRIPFVFRGRAMRAFVVVEAVAADLAIAWASHSYAGLLAGFGVPLLVQRSISQQDLVAERDRARALLAELQAKRDVEVQAAALSERGRIARDMHDVLAHSLAGLSLQLQATRAVAVGAGVGPAVLDPLDKAAALARDGLSEARDAVGALRDPAGLGLDALPALVERHPGDVALSVTGEPVALAPEAGHALYRLTQESLTNAARYAPGSAVRVALDRSPARVRIRVDDDGPAPGRTPLTGQGSGSGLAGMQERLRRVGGTVQAGPRPDGGWRVEATVQLT